MGQAESTASFALRTDVPVRRNHSSSPSTTRAANFPTFRQCCILQKSWSRAQKSGPTSVGARVLLRVFEKDPSVKVIGNLLEVPLSEMVYQQSFHYLAATVTRALNTVMSKIERPGEARKYCRELGRRHVKHVKKGFQPIWWELFAEALTECAIEWEGGQRCKEAMNGWRILVMFIISEMKNGFGEEKKRVASLDSSESSCESSKSSTPPPESRCPFGFSRTRRDTE